MLVTTSLDIIFNVSICAVQYSSHKQYVAIEHLKRDLVQIEMLSL